MFVVFFVFLFFSDLFRWVPHFPKVSLFLLVDVLPTGCEPVGGFITGAETVDQRNGLEPRYIGSDWVLCC